MDFTLSQDQQAIQEEMRRQLADGGIEASRGAVTEDGTLDRKAWARIASTGVFSIMLPSGGGGAGLGRVEAALVFEELGRVAFPGPLVATTLASEVDADAAGGLAVVTAVEGPAPHVVDHLGSSDRLVRVTDGGVSVASAGSAAHEAERLERPFDPLTPVWRVGSIDWSDSRGDAATAERWQRDASVLCSAFSVGLAAGSLSMAVDYAKQRRQFGRPIGSFQALKHALADAATDTEVARAATLATACAIDEGMVSRPDAPSVTSARVLSSRAASMATAVCVQVHGGMGYTWELPAHLYLKRAAVVDASWGGVAGALRARGQAL